MKPNAYLNMFYNVVHSSNINSIYETGREGRAGWRALYFLYTYVSKILTEMVSNLISELNNCFFSSPESKTQVSSCHSAPSVLPSVRP